MKKMTFFALAAVMLSAVAFTGCKSENEPVKKAASVATDVAISLPTQVGGARHMPGATVQLNGATDFGTNGMNGITLVPFGPSALVTTTSVRLGDNIVLGAIGATQAYTDPGNNGRAKVFTNTQVPVGTSAFLFYGESGASGTDFQKGSLTASLTGEPAAFTFSLKPIQSNASTVTSHAAYVGLINYLNAVANATTGGKKWKEYASTDNEGLYETFQNYKTANVLSSFAIRRMMEDLYKSLMPNTSDPMAAAIRDSIARPEYATVNTTTGEVTLVSALQGFPENLDLPQGSLAVAFTGTSGVVGATGAFGGNAAHAYGSLAPAEIDRYVYPSSLWYFSNTKIKTHNTTREPEYTGKFSWQAILDTYDFDNSSVNAKTRSIALKDTVQYAVARLDVMVKFKENTWLVDNDPVATNNKVNNPGVGYPLSAVIVGGQRNVGFDFTPGTYGGSIDYAYTIYDKVMTNTIAVTSTTAYTDPNSTLVLETAANEDEYIALEFTNTSDKDFYGVDGIVPIGGKFYLVGKLTASVATETDSKVFKQDYTTTVRVAIKDLKTAYSTIPNLKAPSLEIGLSVDLTWRAGHTYDLEL